MIRLALSAMVFALGAASALAQPDTDEQDRDRPGGAMTPEELQREPITFELDVPYAQTDDPRQRLDLYLPEEPADEALPVLKRGVELNDKDPGIRYQLFLAYSRLKRKDEADKELAEFKRLDEVNRHAATPLGATVTAGSAMDGETLPPLPARASGDSAKPRTPYDWSRTFAPRCPPVDHHRLPLRHCSCSICSFNPETRSPIVVVQSYFKSHPAFNPW